MEQITTTFFGFLNALLTFFIWLISLSVLTLVLKKIIDKLLFNNLLARAILAKDKVFLLVKIPPSNEQKEQVMEAFLLSLHRVLPNNTYLNLEIVSSEQFLRFYIVINRNYKNSLESQLYAQYPDAEVEEVEDEIPIFDKNSTIAELAFKKASIYPFKTYHNLETDLLKNLSATLAKTEPGEKVFIQLSLKRIGSNFWERGWQNLRFKLFGKKTSSDNKPTIANWKVSQDLYQGRLRAAYVVKDGLVQSKLDTLISLFKAVKGEVNALDKKKRRILPGGIDKEFKARVFKDGDLWTCAEIATIYHFPYKGSVISNIVQTTSKRAPAPDILPREGLTPPQTISLFGETNYRNQNWRFGTKRIDRRRHVYIVGKTGSGKSKLLELLLISDIQNGEGCCLLDPHGDLAKESLLFVPKERVNDVVYVDPADLNFPIGFNPLEPVKDQDTRQHLARFFISIFKKQFASNWNDQMEHLTRFIVLALLETQDSNVLGIPRLLSDTTFRQRVVKEVQDPVVKAFWTTEFSQANEQFIKAAAVPILNKIGQFISNPLVRNMIGQGINMLNFEEFMNNGKIVIINISKGKLGDDNSALLGSMFITKIQQAALARAKIPEEERRDFYFYVDEFQNFATEAFSSILSEARKYRLDLTIAHQYIAQLPEDVKATAFGNVGTLIVFAVGGDDASYLTKEFTPVFSPDDMINLNMREMYVKMSVDGRVTQPFSARTIDVPRPTFDYSMDILSHSRMTYGRNRTEVENEINRWASSAQAIGTTSAESFPEPII